MRLITLISCCAALLLSLTACGEDSPTGSAAPRTAASGDPASRDEAKGPTVTRLDASGLEVLRTRNFRAVLDGEDAGVDTRARGQAWFQVSLDGTILYYRLIVSNIRDVTMAHVHLAEEPGGDGPAVVWLYPEAPPAVTWEGRVNGVLGWGTIEADELVGPLEGMTLDDLLAAMDEGRTYVNVHTEANPGGEIRGVIDARGSGPH
jgi:hypothetical protein